MIDIARELLAELQAAQARIEYLAQTALDDSHAYDFLKRHGRWRQDAHDALVEEIGKQDTIHFARLRAALNGDAITEDSPQSSFIRKPYTKLAVPTISTPDAFQSTQTSYFDTEIPPLITDPLRLFIDGVDDEEVADEVNNDVTATTVHADLSDLTETVAPLSNLSDSQQALESSPPNQQKKSYRCNNVRQ